MDPFTKEELEYLSERRLGRLATIGADGTPHIAPVGWNLNMKDGVIEVGGIRLDKTKKFRDIRHSPRAAIVIDDVLPPWRPRGIEVRGQAEAVMQPEPLIRLYPERIVSWGLVEGRAGPYARNV